MFACGGGTGLEVDTQVPLKRDFISTEKRESRHVVGLLSRQQCLLQPLMQKSSLVHLDFLSVVPSI